MVMRDVRAPSAPSHASEKGAWPPWCFQGWKWSLMKTESKPDCSARRENWSNSVGPNCSADALYPSLSTVRPPTSWGLAAQGRYNSADNSLESVRGLYQGLQSFRNMRRMEASLRKASALRLRFSQSLASRRQRFNQAMVGSTIQRLGNGRNPLTRSERLTISVLRLGRTLSSAVSKIGPA